MESSTSNIFEKDRYILVKNAISQDSVNFIKNSLMYEALRYPNQSDDVIVPLTQTKYASPTTEALTVSLLPTIENITGLSLLPTYSYYRIYKPGDYLKKHKDRKSCEISITINLGFNYVNVNNDYTWDIFVDGKSFQTMPGDMIVYRGIELEHYREPMKGESGSWQVQAFLHYVDANGIYKDYIYDGRPQMGLNNDTRSLPTGRNFW